MGNLAKQVSACFGVPGSGSSSQIIANLIDNDIQFYSTCHEASAAIMAGAFGEVSGLAVCISIKGPGLVNMFPGLVNNYFEDRAVISLSENYDEGSRKVHKKIDHSFVYKAAKYATSLKNVDDSNLSAIARGGRPGVVHVDLCRSSMRHKLLPNQFVSDLPRVGERPAIILGKRCLREQVSLPGIQVPIFTTASAKGVVDETGIHSFGVYCGTGSNEFILEQADSIIAVEVPKYELLRVEDKLSHITLEQFNVLFEEIQSKSWGEKPDDRLYDSWSPVSCFSIMNNVEWNYQLVVDTGLFCVAAEYYWKAGPSRRFIGSLNSRFMGTAIPTSLGVGIAGYPVVCCFGDGGLSYFSELVMANKMKLPICFISFLDGRYSSLSAMHPKIIERDHSWVKLFDGLDIATAECRNLGDFWNTLRDWDKQPMYIECRFSPEIYVNSICDLRL